MLLKHFGPEEVQRLDELKDKAPNEGEGDLYDDLLNQAKDTMEYIANKQEEISDLRDRLGCDFEGCLAIDMLSGLPDKFWNVINEVEIKMGDLRKFHGELAGDIREIKTLMKIAKAKNDIADMEIRIELAYKGVLL
ncbi:MAG: hypothetical protein LBS88_07280 [Tannerellaceae bacterium]|nr:hypothetical protein [Tannerellaceae bacterium]